MVTEKQIWEWLESVNDPEVPVLSVVDLGVVRKVDISESGIKITITPTYSGCPAMQVIEEDIRRALLQEGLSNLTIETVLSPAWTTDWLSENGKRKLKEYGIAPPENEVDKSLLFSKPLIVPCPKCGSRETKMVSEFGSTACKAHYQCLSCQEPFDYFKCLR
jgi:ring-1,2-phenylacetyl-CoA epoxidase subunit PaaD|tara:strand:- start:20692 stop:21177 length:486 start_codon:yes stop_codon:yes gene_type:complete